MVFARKPELADSQEQRDSFLEKAGKPDVTVLHCRIPTPLHRRLRHLVVDEDSNMTNMVIQMLEEGLERRGA